MGGSSQWAIFGSGSWLSELKEVGGVKLAGVALRCLAFWIAGPLSVELVDFCGGRIMPSWGFAEGSHAGANSSEQRSVSSDLHWLQKGDDQKGYRVVVFDILSHFCNFVVLGLLGLLGLSGQLEELLGLARGRCHQESTARSQVVSYALPRGFPLAVVDSFVGWIRAYWWSGPSWPKHGANHMDFWNCQPFRLKLKGRSGGPSGWSSMGFFGNTAFQARVQHVQEGYGLLANQMEVPGSRSTLSRQKAWTGRYTFWGLACVSVPVKSTSQWF